MLLQMHCRIDQSRVVVGVDQPGEACDRWPGYSIEVFGRISSARAVDVHRKQKVTSWRVDNADIRLHVRDPSALVRHARPIGEACQHPTVIAVLFQTIEHFLAAGRCK